MDDHQMLKETFRLAQENNKILRKMRRAAALSRVFTLLMWAVLIILPFWAYFTYFAPIVDSMMQTYQQIQGTSAEAQAQFGDFAQAWREFQERFGGTAQ